jgi:hypothetical protein
MNTKKPSREGVFLMPKVKEDDVFESPLDEAQFKQNLYWKIIVSLQKKIQNLINDNEFVRDQLLWIGLQFPYTYSQCYLW